MGSVFVKSRHNFSFSVMSLFTACLMLIVLVCLTVPVFSFCVFSEWGPVSEPQKFPTDLGT